MQSVTGTALLSTFLWKLAVIRKPMMAAAACTLSQNQPGWEIPMEAGCCGKADDGSSSVQAH